MTCFSWRERTWVAYQRTSGKIADRVPGMAVSVTNGPKLLRAVSSDSIWPIVYSFALSLTGHL
jgi:hypothetical protein